MTEEQWDVIKPKWSAYRDHLNKVTIDMSSEEQARHYLDGMVLRKNYHYIIKTMLGVDL